MPTMVVAVARAIGRPVDDEFDVGVISSMLQGFRKFLMRGNVIDLAVAVVMGSAFTAVVSSVTKGVVQPLLAVVGGNSQLGLGFHLVGSKPATFVAIGPIVSALLDFLMVAAVLYFVLVAPMRSITSRLSANKEKTPTQTELLIEIRDLLAGTDDQSLATTKTTLTTTEVTEAQVNTLRTALRRVRGANRPKISAATEASGTSVASEASSKSVSTP